MSIDPIFDDKLFGSFFVSATFNQSVGQDGQNRYVLQIDEKAPAVILNQNAKDKFGLHPDTPDIAYMRSLGSINIGRENQPYGKYTLVSGGAIPYYDGNILCLQRDSGAQIDANCLTLPAGRMSGLLSIMSAEELNQETIFIVKYTDGKLMALAHYRTGLSEDSVLVAKEKQIRKMEKYFASHNQPEKAELLRKIQGVNDILTQNLDQFLCNNLINEKADQVFTLLGYKTIDVSSGFVFHDKSQNTVEYRDIVDLTMPGFKLVAMFPGEFFTVNGENVVNETQIINQELLYSQIQSGQTQCVATLKNYLSRLMNKQSFGYFNKTVNS